MFNKIYGDLKKATLLFSFLILVVSCNKEVSIQFSEENKESSEPAIIAINYPKAEGTKEVAQRINNAVEGYIVNQTNLQADSLSHISIDEAIKRFHNSYKTFNSDFPETSLPWEALIDGEVTYRSADVISIAINSYLNTGGAHGNTHVKFLNFNPQTGKQYSKNDLIDDLDGLSKIIEEHLKKEMISRTDNQPMEDAFFGKDFQLPESLGFSDEGLIILYNPYEIASYAQGIIEFTVPFEAVGQFLNIY
ncbi:DUF3298 and DUF4163 domain-containing protein [Psychroserpens sp. BH13MA-6]